MRRTLLLVAIFALLLASCDILGLSESVGDIAAADSNIDENPSSLIEDDPGSQINDDPSGDFIVITGVAHDDPDDPIVDKNPISIGLEEGGDNYIFTITDGGGINDYPFSLTKEEGSNNYIFSMTDGAGLPAFPIITMTDGGGINDYPFSINIEGETHDFIFTMTDGGGINDYPFSMTDGAGLPDFPFFTITDGAGLPAFPLNTIMDELRCADPLQPGSGTIRDLSSVEFIEILNNLADFSDNNPGSSWPCNIVFAGGEQANSLRARASANEAFEAPAAIADALVDTESTLRVRACLGHVLNVPMGDMLNIPMGDMLSALDDDPALADALVGACPDLALVDYSRPQIILEWGVDSLLGCGTIFPFGSLQFMPLFALDNEGNLNSIELAHEGITSEAIMYNISHLLGDGINVDETGIVIGPSGEEMIERLDAELLSDLFNSLQEVNQSLNTEDYFLTLEEFANTVAIPAFIESANVGDGVVTGNEDEIIIEDPEDPVQAFILATGIVHEDPDDPIDDDPSGNFIFCPNVLQTEEDALNEVRPAEFILGLNSLSDNAEHNTLEDGKGSSLPCNVIATSGLVGDGLRARIAANEAFTSPEVFADAYASALAFMRITTCMDIELGLERRNEIKEIGASELSADEIQRIADSCADLGFIDYSQPQLFIEMSADPNSAADGLIDNFIFDSADSVPEITSLTFVLAGGNLAPIFAVDIDGNVSSIHGVATGATEFYDIGHILEANGIFVDEKTDPLIPQDGITLERGFMLTIPNDEGLLDIFEDIKNLFGEGVKFDTFKEVTGLINAFDFALTLEEFAESLPDDVIVRGGQEGDDIIIEDPEDPASGGDGEGQAPDGVIYLDQRPQEIIDCARNRLADFDAIFSRQRPPTSSEESLIRECTENSGSR